MSRVRGIIYAVSSAVAFGFIPVFAKFAYSGGAGTATVAFLRFFLASLMLLGILLVRKVELRFNKRQLARLVYISVIGYTATCLTLFSSYKFIAIGLSTTLHFTYPVAVAILSYFIFKERMDSIKIVSIVLSIGGVYILAGSKGSSIDIRGVILALISGLFYSIYTIEIGREDIKAMDSMLLTFYVSLFSSAAIFIYGAAVGDLSFRIKPYSILAIFGIAVVCTVFALLAYSSAVKIIGSSDTAILSTFEPVTGVILGILIFAERLNMVTAAGSTLIIVSVLLFSLSRKKLPEPKKPIEASEECPS
ncbi:MAG: DMT family transporter [Caulobacteraceae bacterium]